MFTTSIAFNMVLPRSAPGISIRIRPGADAWSGISDIHRAMAGTNPDGDNSQVSTVSTLCAGCLWMRSDRLDLRQNKYCIDEHQRLTGSERELLCLYLALLDCKPTTSIDWCLGLCAISGTKSHICHLASSCCRIV